MKALLIVAHGSKKPEPNDEIRKLAEAIQDRAAGRFDVVRHAFIQFAEPLVGDVIDQLASDGMTEIVALPFFIAGGSHVQNDIPEMLAEAEQRHPGLSMTVTTHFGNFEGISDLILSEVE
jgi:sirohydrochlorin cobaltochelatase